MTAIRIIRAEYRRQEAIEALALGRTIAGKEGWDILVEVDGNRLGVSRLAGETAWVVDAFTARGTCCPAYMNGWGARFCRLIAADGDLAEFLDGFAGRACVKECGQTAVPGAGHDMCVDCYEQTVRQAAEEVAR